VNNDKGFAGETAKECVLAVLGVFRLWEPERGGAKPAKGFLNVVFSLLLQLGLTPFIQSKFTVYLNK